MEDQTFENYTHDLGTLVKEKAIEAKKQKDASKDNQNHEYAIGYSMAWYEVVSLMQQQAEAFGISLDRIDLHDVHPDRDLL